jgi:hypothetical protein
LQTLQKGRPPREFTNPLAWAEAERPDVALIIVSNLSNPAKEYLDSYRRNNRPSFKIRCWEKPQLTRMLSRKVSLQRKYNLTDNPKRKSYSDRQEEFFMKVWYGRKAPQSGSRATLTMARRNLWSIIHAISYRASQVGVATGVPKRAYR